MAVSPPRLSRFELELMNVLWRLGRASVREVHEALSGRKRPAYTTVQTMMTRLQEKGALRHVRKIGNAHIYEPAIPQAGAYRRLIDELIGLLGGSARPLMSHLVESNQVSLEDLRAMEKTLQETARGRKKGDKEG
jgi:BlaI family penicillinase repressor